MNSGIDYVLTCKSVKLSILNKIGIKGCVYDNAYCN